MRLLASKLGLLVLGAAPACQAFLTREAPSDAVNTTGDASTNDVGAPPPDAGVTSSSAGCGLTERVLRVDLEGTPALLVTDDEGAYFTEQLGDGGTNIASVTPLLDGGLAFRSVAAPGEPIDVIWPDSNVPGDLRYVRTGPSGQFFLRVNKSLKALDEVLYVAGPGATRFGPARDKLAIARNAVPSGRVEIAFANPDVKYSFERIAQAPSDESVLELTTDGTAIYMSTATSILGLSTNGVTALVPQDAGLTPTGPIAVSRGVLYGLSGTDILAVNSSGGPIVRIGQNAVRLAVDDRCVFTVNSSGELTSAGLDGGSATVVADAGSANGLRASVRGVFWTTAFPRRLYAILRPPPL